MCEALVNDPNASSEKHLPVLEKGQDIVKVSVGSVTHPMVSNHYIEWICLETKKTKQIKYLKPEDEPKACFRVCKCDEVVSVYAYCNLHGLWRMEL